ncbi:FAD binding domain-containing protein [Phytohalomonas tamaricis]|uniref:FAD binding domain-containing protein n=1 Tax=Phytohalomonas tamaricis TaxID=2081032 RepID=UPI000D0AFFF4|nr:xanthine dehydrogenase family protein subunit M [Phytohalomonas tamaricis]
MKAADFLYHRAGSVAEAVTLLDEYAGEARLLAGGQSLMPMLNMRLWRLGALIDVNQVPGLDGIEAEGEGDLEETRIGALTRYVSLERSEVVASRLPLLAEMVRHIGDRQVRNRGTLGGSLVQGDPTAEMPLGCLVLGARVRVESGRGSREIAMGEFYDGSYAAALEFDEMVTEIRFPRHPSHFAFSELTRRHGDFCVLSVAVTGECDSDGCWHDLRIGLGGVSDMPVPAEAASARLSGTRLTDDDIREAAALTVEDIDPPSDMRATAEYRTHLVPVHVRRALQQLRARASATELLTRTRENR